MDEEIEWDAGQVEQHQERLTFRVSALPAVVQGELVPEAAFGLDIERTGRSI
jgi:hypothetical protein